MRFFYRDTGDRPGGRGLRLAVRTAGLADPSDAPGDRPALPPVLLVHGMGSDHTTWNGLARRLRRSGRALIAVDLRGHGRSAHTPTYPLAEFGADLLFLLDELGIGSVDVVAHSLGAHTALRMAAAAPDRVRRLALEEIPPMPRSAADLAEPVAMSAGPVERARGVLAVVANPSPVLRFDHRMTRQVTSQFDDAQPQWWSAMGAVDAPVLVISGGARSFLPTDHLRVLADTLPDGRLLVIDAGHSVHRDRPDAFAAAVEPFLTARSV